MFHFTQVFKFTNIELYIILLLLLYTTLFFNIPSCGWNIIHVTSSYYWTLKLFLNIFYFK